MNRIIIRNFTSLTKNTSKTIRWERVGSIDVKLKSISKNNSKKKQDKKRKKESDNIKFTEYDYYSI
jgi:hypothetical protein